MKTSIARAGLALAAVLLGSSEAQAQIGALAASAAVVTADGTEEYVFAGAPVFADNGLVLQEKWSAGAFATNQEFTFPSGVTLAVTGFSFGAFAAVGSSGMVGVSIQPVVQTSLENDFASAEESGTGNLGLYGKAVVHEAGATQIAVSGRAFIPMADPFGQARSTFFGGIGFSHQRDAKTSIHGGAGLAVTAESDGIGDQANSTPIEGTTGFSANAAIVRQLSPKAWLSGEFLASAGSDVWEVSVAPALRLRAGERVFVDLGVAIGALESDDSIPMDYAFALGATYVPGR